MLRSNSSRKQKNPFLAVSQEMPPTYTFVSHDEKSMLALLAYCVSHRLATCNRFDREMKSPSFPELYRQCLNERRKVESSEYVEAGRKKAVSELLCSKTITNLVSAARDKERTDNRAGVCHPCKSCIIVSGLLRCLHVDAVSVILHSDSQPGTCLHLLYFRTCNRQTG